ncbi:hypothetical protein YC2023_099038 [Brassica napus]
MVLLLVLREDHQKKETDDGGPFCSLTRVAAPPYVQMNDWRIKQKLLMEIQTIWDQYNIYGRQEKERHFVTPVSACFNIVSGAIGYRWFKRRALERFRPIQRNELPSLKVILSILDTILISKTTKIITDVNHFKRSSLTFSFIHS